MLFAGCGNRSDSKKTPPIGPQAQATTCERWVTADVVAIPQTIFFNRLGSNDLNGQVFALARDLVYTGGGLEVTQTWLLDTPEWKNYKQCTSQNPAVACTSEVKALIIEQNNVKKRPVYRSDRRPRPLVLRANVGDCLEVNLVNLLDPENVAADTTGSTVGFHPTGMAPYKTIIDSAQFSGENRNSLAPASTARTYRFAATEEAIHFVSSPADSDSTQLESGLFGVVHVQQKGAEYYRSQVTNDDLVKTYKAPPSGDKPPTINYKARFKTADADRPWKGVDVPILEMLRDTGGKKDGVSVHETIYGDLTAIITGPNAGAFATPRIPNNPAYPNSQQPFREFAIIYHEPSGAVSQAFPQFKNGPLVDTLAAGQDLFGLNYGVAGIGAEILANRLGVGPQAECTECMYEEFFLSSWAVSDPAMPVDVYADQNLDSDGNKKSTVKPATVALYPDDPSNVYHSYLGDQVTFRVHHGGAIHHLHHLHAHQWLHTPKSSNGHYLDSQLIGPGASFNQPITYNGGGNRNQTVGDSIFHCHFYPHFAAGMWALWRVHDVFEAGTETTMVNVGGIERPIMPVPGSRALPDGEIVAGTAIPGLVPVPTIPIAPMPSEVYIEGGQVYYGAPNSGDRWGTSVTKNPGFPFFIAGIAGQRAVTPPNDFAALGSKTLDGGLPRYVIQSPASQSDITQFTNKYDFSKFANNVDAIELPEKGTQPELVAMQAHSTRRNPSFTPEGTPGDFIYNGMQPQQGAPYADPCYTVSQTCLQENGGNYNACDPIAVTDLRQYRAADIEHDVTLNKQGWHYPQQRLTVLWEDIHATLDNTRPPEPFFFRANSGQCVEYWLANVVPEYYALDNFQVRTPTDILGQHIHLVKFDVTSSDGAANGWNYQDGTLSNETVVERIKSINAHGGIQAFDGSARRELKPEPAEFLCKDLPAKQQAECAKKWRGAQATVQRWWADPQLNDMGKDKTLRTVFTHDHFSPSTHQQAGLYAGLLVEPKNTRWYNPETGVELSTGRGDGGPTSWQALVVNNNDKSESFREFALEFQDFALAYSQGGTYEGTPYPEVNETMDPAQVNEQNTKLDGIATTDGNAIRPLVGGFIWAEDAQYKSSPPVNAPNVPQLISSPNGARWGTYSVNYRAEPVAMRLSNDTLNSLISKECQEDPNCAKLCQENPESCDSASVFRSITRINTALNSQHVGESHYPPALTSGVYGTDPFTPMLRAYEGDNVQIRTLVGAHLSVHNFNVQGLSWFAEPSFSDSGYTNNQSMGISEHFEMLFRMPGASHKDAPTSAGLPTDTCGKPGSAGKFTDYVYSTSSTVEGLAQGNWGLIRSYAKGDRVQCLQPLPTEATTTPMPFGCPAGAPQRQFKVEAIDTSLIFNARAKIDDKTAIAFWGCDKTLSPDCDDPSKPRDITSPMVLRAAAGECITVTLENKFSPDAKVFTETAPLANSGSAVLTGAVTLTNTEASPSKNVGLSAQMASWDGNVSAGLTAGFNNVQTAAPGATVQYTWYAGVFERTNGSYIPVELGAVNLLTADPLTQTLQGLYAGLVIEPSGSTWSAEQATSASALITGSDGSTFHDFVLFTAVSMADDFLANYGTEPDEKRFDGTPLNFACQYANKLQNPKGTELGNPTTPIFEVENPADAVRLRLLAPWGNSNVATVELFSHLWQEEPYTKDSTVMGNNPASEWIGGDYLGWAATSTTNALLATAGPGPNQVPGDYLYRQRPAQNAAKGVWGVVRVRGKKGAPVEPFFCVPPYPNQSGSTGSPRARRPNKRFQPPSVPPPRR